MSAGAYSNANRRQLPADIWEESEAAEGNGHEAGEKFVRFKAAHSSCCGCGSVGVRLNSQKQMFSLAAVYAIVLGFALLLLAFSLHCQRGLYHSLFETPVWIVPQGLACLTLVYFVCIAVVGCSLWQRSRSRRQERRRRGGSRESQQATNRLLGMQTMKAKHKQQIRQRQSESMPALAPRNWRQQRQQFRQQKQQQQEQQLPQKRHWWQHLTQRPSGGSSSDEFFGQLDSDANNSDDDCSDWPPNSLGHNSGDRRHGQQLASMSMGEGGLRLRLVKRRGEPSAANLLLSD